MNTIDALQLRDMIAALAQRIGDEREYLNRLDAAVGDGDHGTAISTAFAAAVDEIAALG